MFRGPNHFGQRHHPWQKMFNVNFHLPKTFNLIQITIKYINQKRSLTFNFRNQNGVKKK